jgi:hypothetical protein
VSADIYVIKPSTTARNANVKLGKGDEQDV